MLKNKVGRPLISYHLKREALCIRLPKWLLDKLPEKKGEFIEQALKEKMKVEEPPREGE